MERIYFFCAVFGSLFVVAQLFLTLFAGLGMEDVAPDSVDTDATDVADHAGYDFLRILSLRTVTAGLAFFGLVGMAGIKSGIGSSVVFVIAAFCGLVAIFVVFFLYRLISSFKSNGAVIPETLPNSKGNVYVKIPPKRSGSGKVIVNHQERSMEYEAFSDSESELSAGTPIIVKKSLGPNQVLVEFYEPNEKVV